MRFGVPHVITSDQGSEFHYKLNKEIASLLQIDHHLITAYHPQVITLLLWEDDVIKFIRLYKISNPC